MVSICPSYFDQQGIELGEIQPAFHGSVLFLTFSGSLVSFYFKYRFRKKTDSDKLTAAAARTRAKTTATATIKAIDSGHNIARSTFQSKIRGKGCDNDPFAIKFLKYYRSPEI